MSKSWTHSIMDLEMDFTYNGNKPKWVYKAGVLPRLTKDSKYDWRHDFAKPILRSDCTMGHSWMLMRRAIWSQDSTHFTTGWKQACSREPASGWRSMLLLLSEIGVGQKTYPQ